MARRAVRSLLAASMAVGLLLLLLDLQGAGPAESVRSFAATVAGPPMRLVAGARDRVAGWIDGSDRDRAEVAALRAEVERLRTEAAAVARDELADRAARELSALAPPDGFLRVPARLVGLSSSSDLVRSATVSAGSDAGVRAGMPVLAAGGIAGLVETTGPRVATVRLLVDPGSSLPARVSTSGEVGILTGTGSAVALRLLDPLGRMDVGDLVVTIGTQDGALPPEVPLGRISSISGSAADLSRTAIVTPHVDDSTLDRVEVLVAEERP